MSAPEHVPATLVRASRVYRSSPQAVRRWEPVRPGDFAGERPQPRGAHLGNPGPDQGYALRLAELLADRVRLTDGEELADALTGAVLVGLARASVFGRAPVLADVEIGLRVWGFLDPDPDPELVAVRRQLFTGISNPHHYEAALEVPEHVHPDTLRMTAPDVAERHAADWRALLRLNVPMHRVPPVEDAPAAPLPGDTGDDPSA